MLAEVATRRALRIPRGVQPTFTSDGTHALFIIRPSREAQAAARGNRRGNRAGNAATPRDSLRIVNLATGTLVKIADVQGRRLPSDPVPGAAGWVAVHLRPPTAADAMQAAGEATPRGHGSLLLRDLASGNETRHPRVVTHSWAASGERILLTDSVAEGEAQGARGVRLVTPGTRGRAPRLHPFHPG